METAIFAGGCFWCTEAIFKRIKGVSSVVSGYSGGDSKEKPNYEKVSQGGSGYAEAINITFDPEIIPYEKLVEIFFHLHDPTTLNRQGNDVGIQYRSIIFFHNREQEKIAQKVKKQIEKEHIYANRIVTEILPFENFYKAEDYHQDFYAKNPDYGYCRLIIDPKINKLLREFSGYT